MDKPFLIDSTYFKKHRCGIRKFSIQIPVWVSLFCSLKLRRKFHTQCFYRNESNKVGNLSTTAPFTQEMLKELQFSFFVLFCFELSFVSTHWQNNVHISAYSNRFLWLFEALKSDLFRQKDAPNFSMSSARTLKLLHV